MKTHEIYIKEVKEKNPNVKVIGTYMGAKIKIDHLCKKCNAVFLATPSSILQGHGCKTCGIKLNSQHRTMTSSQYKEKVSNINSDIMVLDEYQGSNIKIKHQCKKCNHVWEAVPNSIIQGRGCPVCAIKNNSIKKTKTHDEYKKELSMVNQNIVPLEQYINAKTKILHKCLIDGYEWKITPDDILKHGNCPECINRMKAQKYNASTNNLMMTHPHIASEWCYDKNEGLLPTMVSYGSNKKVWWECPICHHEYLATISKRTAGSGCPNCAKQYKVSNTELHVYFYVKKYFSETISSYSDVLNELSEIDIFIPNLKIGIEYDGGLYHQNISRDKNKDVTCKMLGIKLIRISEPECPKYESDCEFIYLHNHSQKELELAIIQILNILGINEPKVNFNEDLVFINNLIIYNKKANALSKQYPEIAAEWHPMKNGNLNPDNVSYGSKKRVWWICSRCGNEWIATPSDRTGRKRGTGCPVCGKEKAAMSHHKPIYCPELHQIFEGAIEVDKNFNIDKKNINNCLSGRQKTTGRHPLTNEKLHWYYVYDQNRSNGVIIKGAISLGLITEEQIDKIKNCVMYPIKQD